LGYEVCMDEVARLKEEVLAGRIDADRLIDLVVTLQRQLQDARRRIEEFEKKLGGAAKPTWPRSGLRAIPTRFVPTASRKPATAL
jgi:predicted  nucleic acid-binding Zn-ribbon protein